MAAGAGGSFPAGERNSRNWRRSAVYARMLWAEELMRRSSARYRSMWPASSDIGMQVFFQRGLRAPANFGVAGLFIVTQPMAQGFVERWQQVERDVGGLVIGGVGAGDIVAQRPEGRCARQGTRRLARGQRCGVHPGHQS